MREKFGYLACVWLLLCSLNGFGQDTLFYENFETGGNLVTLNTSDLGAASGSSGLNEWIINNAYTGGTGSLICLGFPFTYTVANTAAQPGGIFNSPNSFYLHTISDEATADNIFCSSFQAADGVCMFAETNFSGMTNDISTAGYNNVALNFWWACGGGTAIHGEVYYSTNSGTSWTQLTAPLSQYKNQTTWTQQTISNAAFDGQATLRFGFRFVNGTSTAATDPGFSIDDVVITGFPTASIATDSVSTDTFCPGSPVAVHFTANGNYTAGNVFTAELSDNMGSFAAPGIIGTLTSTTSGTINGTIPGATGSGSNFRIRIVSSMPAVTGTDNGTDLVVLALPVAGAISPVLTDVCSGSGTTLTLSGASGTIDWQSSSNGVNFFSTGNSGTSFSTGPLTQPAWYRVVVSNACGSDTTTNAIVVIQPNPDVGLIVNHDDSICRSDSSILVVAQSVGSLQWYESTDGVNFNAIPGDTTPIFLSPPLSVQHYYLLVASNSCGADSLLFPVYVDTVQASFTFSMNGLTATFLNQSTGGQNYLWAFGDGNVASFFNAMHTYAAAGTYTVTLTVTSPLGCIVDTMVTISPMVGLSEGLPGTEITVSPNPFSDAVRIQMDLTAAAPIDLQVLDLEGRLVAQLVRDERQSGRHAFQWRPDQGVTAGIYFLRVQVGDAVSYRKLLRLQ